MASPSTSLEAPASKVTASGAKPEVGLAVSAGTGGWLGRQKKLPTKVYEPTGVESTVKSRPLPLAPTTCWVVPLIAPSDWPAPGFPMAELGTTMAIVPLTLKALAGSAVP